MRTSPPRPLRLVEPTPLTFASVYEAHAAFVRRTLRHLDVPAGSVDDVLHDVFLIVHRRLHDFDHERSMRSWLYGIARRVAMHHRRSGARRTKREHFAPTPPPPVQPDDVVAQREAAAWVETFLRSLDSDQRAVFTLCDVEGLPAPEVAAATGTKLNTVYSRLRLARRRFERALAARDEGASG